MATRRLSFTILIPLSTLVIWTCLYGDLKTSVIIPCHFKDSNYLEEVLVAYEQQSIVPDEIVISLSKAHLADQEILQCIENQIWPFSLTVIKTDRKLFPGRIGMKLARKQEGI